MIINCAEKQTDINKNVELMVRLVTQYNEQIGSIGPQMTENLLNEEKKREYPTGQSKIAGKYYSHKYQCHKIVKFGF